MQRAQPHMGVQLFTLRETGDDLPTMVAKVTALGYAGVELAAGQLRGVEPGGLAAILADAGMVVSSAHVVAAPEGGVPESDLDALQTLGVDIVVLTYLPNDGFLDADALARSAATIETIAAQVRPRGMTLGYHNHTWELETFVDGRPALVGLFERLPPDVIAEVDVYWAQVGGADPAGLVAELGERVQLLHVKDGPALDPTAPMVAVGTGAVDVPAVLRANPAVRWHIVELDRCATDVYVALAESLRFLERTAADHGS